MATPDLEVIKDIPGYKVILKAILKSQIQQLVEQLAAHTEEESVILTASVTDGTLSHLGSDSGKCFLQDYEDVKSQFLGFCLKKHHAKKHVDERLEALPSATSTPAYTTRPRYPPARAPRQMSPQNYRGRGARHEPYPVGRIKVSRTPASVPDPVSDIAHFSSIIEEAIKSEPFESQNAAEDSYRQTESGVEDQSNISTVSTSDDSKNIPVSDNFDGISKNFGDNSELPNMFGDENASRGGEKDSEIDQDIKVESITEADMDLEITGVEHSANQDPQGSEDNWEADMTGAMGYDPTGAMGNQSEFQQGNKTGATDEILVEFTEEDITDMKDMFTTFSVKRDDMYVDFPAEEMLEKKIVRGRPSDAQKMFRTLLREAAVEANLWKRAPNLAEISDIERMSFFKFFEITPQLLYHKKELWKRLGESLQNRRKYISDKQAGKRGKKARKDQEDKQDKKA